MARGRRRAGRRRGAWDATSTSDYLIIKDRVFCIRKNTDYLAVHNLAVHNTARCALYPILPEKPDGVATRTNTQVYDLQLGLTFRLKSIYVYQVDSF